MIPVGKSFRDSLKGYRGLVKAHSLSGIVTEVAVSLIVAAILVGSIALPIFFGTNTTGWGATNIIVWGVIPTVSLAVIIIGLVRYFEHRGHAE